MTTPHPIFNLRKSAPNDKSDREYVDVPKDLYQAHLKPGVIFRVHLTEAIIKMQYRRYDETVDSSVVEADAEYLRLARKLLYDEIQKFEELRWLTESFTAREELHHQHMCGSSTKYTSMGIPPTNFTGSEDYMKRSCLFNAVYLDRIPYVVGEDGSLMAAVAPPILHCDAATCTSVPFVDSLMLDDQLQMTHVRSVTRCQAECRLRCRNDALCLEHCAELCDTPLS